MRRIQIGVARYNSVAQAIGRELGLETMPECRLGRGRTCLTFRNLGASRWSVDQQADDALRIAGVTRNVLLADYRPSVRRLARRAVVIVFEDISLIRGCEVTSRWECVVRAP